VVAKVSGSSIIGFTSRVFSITSSGLSSRTLVKGVLSRIFVRIFLPLLVEQCKKAPLEVVSRNYVISPLRPI
jgi:hypothetical protein